MGAITGRMTPEMFFIDRQDRRSLQMQLATSIISMILDTRAQPGTRLPSSRKLAGHLGLSRLTVTLVYQDLVVQGYLEAVPRSGVMVSACVPQRRIGPVQAPVTADKPIDWGDWLPRDFSGRRQIRKPRDWRSYRYPFIYGQVDPGLFDHAAWRDCARRALGAREFTGLADDQLSQDDPLLLDYIRKNTLPRRGISARSEEILITLGAQNAIWIAVQLLARPDRCAVIEEPGFPDFATALDYARMPIHYMSTDARGLDPMRLPADVGLVMATPSHNIPEGTTLSLERRRALLDLANARDFLIVEDDYEYEMSFLEAPSPALKSLDGAGRVIYVGSFSKSLFPGLRIGYMVAPEPFIREARALRAMMLRHAPGHMQRVTGYFLALGHYDAHVVRQREAFRRRREVLVAALQDTDFTIAGAARHGGSSLWVAAPGHLDSRALGHRLAQRSVLIEEGHPFFARPPDPCPLFRMGFSAIPEGQIAEGVRIMHEVLGEMTGARS